MKQFVIKTGACLASGLIMGSVALPTIASAKTTKCIIRCGDAPTTGPTGKLSAADLLGGGVAIPMAVNLDCTVYDDKGKATPLPKQTGNSAKDIAQKYCKENGAPGGCKGSTMKFSNKGGGESTLPKPGCYKGNS